MPSSPTSPNRSGCSMAARVRTLTSGSTAERNPQGSPILRPMRNGQIHGALWGAAFALVGCAGDPSQKILDDFIAVNDSLEHQMETGSAFDRYATAMRLKTAADS